MPNPEITFFIPVRNGLPYIEECINSIRSQTFQNWQLFIVDNQSSDGTAETCSRFLADERITFIRNEKDLGMIGNYNKCLDMCRTKYYAMLSHDDMYGCDRAVEDSYAILERDPQICAVYSHINWIDEKSDKIMSRKFADVGKVASDATALNSILRCRNLFGVPLLVRQSRVQGRHYDAAFYHTSDIEFSTGIGRGADNFVIDRACYSIRFHQSNSTMRHASMVRPELEEVAKKYGIRLGIAQKYMMRLNEWFMRLQRFVFYTYLDHFRRAGKA